MITVYLHRADKSKFEISAGQTTVGRGLSNNLVIKIPKVSRKHAYFENQDIINFGELDTNLTIEIYRPTLLPQDIDKSINYSQDTGNENAFGFKSNEINFSEEGVGREAATKLAKRFRKLLPKPVSSGGMGKILLVQEIMSGRVVALKVMLEIALNREPLVQQFVREAVITARLQHPNIIPVYDIGFLSGDQLYYTMRYIEGKAFNQLIYKVELEERLRILRSAALAVDHAHSKGLWHRDLKPENILVGELGDTYVIDWGLVSIQPGYDYKLDLPRIVVDRAPHIEPDRLLEETPKATTEPFFPGKPTILGTPPYMAPEQFEGPDQIMGKVSDVWAFGVMLFQALTGQHPIKNYRSLDVDGMAAHVVHKNLPQARDRAPKTPEELNDLCRRMLIRDSARRMPDLRSFIDEITQYLKGRGATLFSFGILQPAIDPRVVRPQKRAVDNLQEENTDLKDTKSDKTEPFRLLNNNLHKKNFSLKNELVHLKQENTSLKNELDRYKRRNQILFEMSQLGLFGRARRKELQRQLIDI